MVNLACCSGCFGWDKKNFSNHPHNALIQLSFILMTPEIFKTLLTGYYAGTLTDKEKLELSALLHDPQNREQLEQLFSGNLADPDSETAVDRKSVV